MNSKELHELLDIVTKPIYQIEIQIGIPATVLQKALKGKRKLPKKWSIRLKDYVQRKEYLIGAVPKKVKTETTESEKQKEEPKNDEKSLTYFQKRQMGLI